MSAQTEKTPRLKAPPGACDTHFHIYDTRFPFAPTAASKPPEASIADYLAMCRRVGIARHVVVQSSAYGTDNRCTLEATAALGAAARAIVVVDESVTDGELERLTGLGARGIRFHMFPGGVLPWDAMDRMAARVLPFGWIVQVQCDGHELPEHESLLRRIRNTMIVDHVGKFLEPVPPRHPAFRSLLRLVENGRTYVKLAAPYETSKAGPPYYDDVGALAKELIAMAPERIIWASNWPQRMASGERGPDSADMLDLLLDWAPDAQAQKLILVDNPARLYGFE
jgi:D-galactarolactone isomerase